MTRSVISFKRWARNPGSRFYLIHMSTFAAFRQSTELTTWMMWITDSGPDAELKTRQQRTAAEQHVAAHHGWLLTSDEFWIAARHPAARPHRGHVGCAQAGNGQE